MSIYDSDRRYRRQMAGRLTRSVVYLLILGGVGLVSYQLGVEDLEAQKRQHEQVLDEINGRLAEMDQRVADQALQVRQALDRARVTEQRYAADVPRGTDRELYDLIRARIADGLSVARLRFLIGSARRKRDCLDPDTRRFVVRTPVTSGPRSAASFGKDRITITGRGASAKSADGRPQAWFDPSKPVRLTFTAVDQPSVEHAGVLPLSHSVVLGEREFRFLVQAGRRGFVLVTAEDCAYP
ncbi:MAG: hypothetical protein VX131_11290 [Pseudomonadota bacterium]|nr:hypothetical protein [Pseudomonadota bacterium]